MLEQIIWLAVGAIIGAAAYAAFREKIQEWATRVVGFLLDTINAFVEVTSNALVYLIREGNKYYTEARLFVKNTSNNTNRMESKRQEIKESDIPQEQLAIMKKKEEDLLLQQKTR